MMSLGAVDIFAWDNNRFCVSARDRGEVGGIFHMERNGLHTLYTKR